MSISLTSFQVRGTPRKEHGHYFQPILRHDGLWFVYRGLDDIWRQTRIDMHPAPTSLDGRRAKWNLKLAPLHHSEIEVTIRPVVGDPSRRIQCHATSAPACASGVSGSRSGRARPLNSAATTAFLTRRSVPPSATSTRCRFRMGESTSSPPASRGSPPCLAATPSLPPISRSR